MKTVNLIIKQGEGILSFIDKDYKYRKLPSILIDEKKSLERQVKAYCEEIFGITNDDSISIGDSVILDSDLLNYVIVDIDKNEKLKISFPTDCYDTMLIPMAWIQKRAFKESFYTPKNSQLSDLEKLSNPRSRTKPNISIVK